MSAVPASATEGRREPATILSQDEAVAFAAQFEQLVQNISIALLGKDQAVRLVLTALFAQGHVLLEDAPGTGKTSLARALAASITGTHNRIQFTPDLLPSDVTGVTVYDQKAGTFDFHRGPVFAGVVLADEINRASPKTQSSLLEVMEEGHVTVDGTTYAVPDPFIVVATQNPIEQAGTYRLPEAQLDRFLVRLALGYPDAQAAIEILAGSATRDRAAGLMPVLDVADVRAMSKAAGTVYVDRTLLAYANALVEATRSDLRCRLGASVRGGLALVRCAKVWAASQGRHYVVPDDVKVMAQPVLAHRLVLDPDAELAGTTAQQIVADVLGSVAPPGGGA